MIEVYFCSAPKTKQREEIAKTCKAIWQAMDCFLVPLTPEVLGCSPFEFQRERRIFADEDSTRDVYIVTDDDCIPNDVEKAIRCLRSHPEFGLVSLWPSNAVINRWTPEDYEVYEDLEVMEHFSVGGVRICRKGAMLKGWPVQTGVGYDAEHCQALRDCGWRSGYSQHSRCVHLGEGASDLWYPSSSPAEVLQ